MAPLNKPISESPTTNRPRKGLGFIRVHLRRIVIVALLMTAVFLLRPAVVELAVWRGRSCLEDRAHERGLSWLTWAEWLDGNHAEVQFLLAKANRRLGRFDILETHLKRAHELHWDVRQLEREQWIALAQTGQYAAVSRHWPELLTDAGADGPEICNAYVTECLGQFRLNDALRVLTAWEADFPADPQPHFLRGNVWDSLKKPTAAAEEFVRALELAPERTDIRQQLARSLMRQLRIAEAEEHLQRCLKADATNTAAAVARAICLQKLNRIDEARKLLQSQLRLHPDNLEALLVLGDLELAAGRPSEALRHLKRAVEIEPVDREIRFNLATALEAVGEKEAAAKEFAFVNEATKPMLRLSKLTEQLLTEPDNIELRYEIADITWKYKSHTDGARWFLSLLELAPAHGPTHRALAEHYRLLGDATRADYHQRQQAQEISP